MITYARASLTLFLFVVSVESGQIELPDLKDASDSLIDIVLSDDFDKMFNQGKVKISGLKILRHIEENSKLRGENFEILFRGLIGAESMADLESKKFNWNQATSVINAIIKLSDNISVNESRKPNTKYKAEDDRITEAKKLMKEKRKKAKQRKQEL